MKLVIGTLVVIALLFGSFIWAFPIAALVTLFGNIELLSRIISILLGITAVVGLILICLSFIVDSNNHQTYSITAKISSMVVAILLLMGSIKILLPKNGEMLLYAVGAQILYQNEDAQKIAKSATGILSSAVKVVELKAKQWENNISTFPISTEQNTTAR